MSTGLDIGGGGGGRKGREFFLSTHRCPEVDLLPHHDSETKIPQLCSLVPAEKSFTCAGQSEASYLDVSSTCYSEEEEEEETSISDWSEEDLSLHFSPSVILPSDDDESDPESGFECVDITVETLVKGQEGEGLKMVPKRQIQLKKKKETENIINHENTEKLQVIQKDGPAEGGGANNEGSAKELLSPNVYHRPDLFLRQHSMPTSLHTHSTTSSDVDSYRIYRGLVAGASQGFHVGGNSRQLLQKSFSLDETKTKMASCIIKSVLSKKMQVEQNNSKSSYLQKKPAMLPDLPQPADQQRVMEGGGGETSCPVGKTGGGVFKAPVHLVRDMRTLVKNPYSLSFSTTPTTPENYNKPAGFKVIGQEDSPPPTYQQAVGVKGHNETKRSCQASVYSSLCRGHVAKVTASLSQPQDTKQSIRFSCPIIQQRRGSKPMISRHKVDAVTCPLMLDFTTNTHVSSDLSELRQSEKARGICHQAASPTLASTPTHTQHLLSAREQSCLYTPTALPAFPHTLYPHLGKVSYIHSPLSYIQTQLQPPPPAPTLHLLKRSEENQSGLTVDTSDQPDCFVKTCPPHWTRTTGDQESKSNTVTPVTQEQHEQQKLQQQQFLCSIQGFLPTQVGRDFLVDITGSAATPGALLRGPAHCHVMSDPKSGRCFYVDMPSQHQRKMLLDPETGQYVQVLLPTASSTPNASVFPVHCANPIPTVLSVMQFKPTIALSSLYAPPCLPFILHRPSVNFTHTSP